MLPTATAQIWVRKRLDPTFDRPYVRLSGPADDKTFYEQQRQRIGKEKNEGADKRHQRYPAPLYFGKLKTPKSGPSGEFHRFRSILAQPCRA